MSPFLPYRENAKLLNSLLSQIRARGEADAEDWEAIRVKIADIGNMKQSFLKSVFEFISSGQGSIVEQQGIQLGILADELADKFGYARVKTWGDLFSGGYGKFEKNQSE